MLTASRMRELGLADPPLPGTLRVETAPRPLTATELIVVPNSDVLSAGVLDPDVSRSELDLARQWAGAIRSGDLPDALAVPLSRSSLSWAFLVAVTSSRCLVTATWRDLVEPGALIPRGYQGRAFGDRAPFPSLPRSRLLPPWRRPASSRIPAVPKEIPR